jgi:hypothetical protein
VGRVLRFANCNTFSKNSVISRLPRSESRLAKGLADDTRFGPLAKSRLYDRELRPLLSLLSTIFDKSVRPFNEIEFSGNLAVLEKFRLAPSQGKPRDEPLFSTLSSRPVRRPMTPEAKTNRVSPEYDRRRQPRQACARFRTVESDRPRDARDGSRP